jgi:hypothetical protein
MSCPLVPDKGPPRILRFVSPEAMPSARTLFVLDRATNVLTINNHLFAQLSSSNRRMVERTQAASHEITHHEMEQFNESLTV